MEWESRGSKCYPKFEKLVVLQVYPTKMKKF
jgi:hypothetical protein